MKVHFISLIILCMIVLSACNSTTAPTDRSSTAPSSTASSAPSASSKSSTSTAVSDWPDTPVSDFDYEYSGELQGVVITNYKGENALKVRIPDTIEGEPVVGVGLGKDMGGWTAGAFYQSGIMAVHFPDTVTTIFERAFDCSGLTSVELSENVTCIEYRAFYCKGIKSFTVSPNNPVYTEIDGVLFSKDLTTLIQFPAVKSGTYSIPDNVTHIERDAFAYAKGLTGLTFGSNVTRIGDLAFFECSGLDEATKARILEINPTMIFSH